MTRRSARSALRSKMPVSVMAVGALVGAACAGDGSSAGGFSVESAIAQIPVAALRVDDARATVTIADFEQISDALGVDRPSDPTDLDATVDWLRSFGPQNPDGEFVPVVVLPFELIGHHFVTDYDAYIEELGFGIPAIETIAELSMSPARFTAVTGDVAFNEELAEVAPGVRAIGQGDDFEINLDGGRPPLRPLNRPLRVAERDGVGVVSLATDPVQSWVSGDFESLADLDQFGEIARRLDARDVISAVIFTSSDGPLIDGGRETDTLTSTGIGWNADSSGSYAVIVYHYGSADGAAAELDAIAARFDAEWQYTDGMVADQVMLDSIDLDGADIVATVRFTDESHVSVVYNALVRGDTLFVDG